MRGLAKRLVNRLPWAGVDRVFAVSDFVRDRLLANGVPPDRVRTILNGIDVDAWRCPDGPIDPPLVTFFAAARAARYKGVLDSSRRQRKSASASASVISACDTPAMARTSSCSARRWDVAGSPDAWRCWGSSEPRATRLCRADVIVVPFLLRRRVSVNRQRGARQRTAADRDACGGIPELVGDPGNAVLVPPGDPAALATAMADLARDGPRRRDIGARGRLRAHQALRQDVYHATVIRALFAEFGLGDARVSGA